MLRRLHDPRLAEFTTITRVEVSGDLQIARVYFSVPGGESAEHKTIAAMNHASGFVQRLVAQALTTRHCPELRFEIDQAAKLAQKTLALLDENRRRNPALFETLEEPEADRKEPGDATMSAPRPPRDAEDRARGREGDDMDKGVDA